MRRRWAAAMVTSAGLMFVPVAFASGAPKLLSNSPGDSSSFDVRPIAMSFYHYREDGGTDYVGGAHSTMEDAFDAKDRIRWQRWGDTARASVAYYIVGVATGHTDRVRATVRAWRVRSGRFTRFAIAVRRAAMTYELQPTRVKTNGVPGGLPAWEWCQQGPLERSHRCFEP